MKENLKVYDRIIDLCHQRNISVRSLERELGFSNGQIKIMRDSKISSERLLAIATYFGTSMEYLLTGVEPEYYTNPETARIAQRIFDDPSQRILFDASEDLSPEDALFLAEMAKKMKRTNPDG